MLKVWFQHLESKFMIWFTCLCSCYHSLGLIAFLNDYLLITIYSMIYFFHLLQNTLTVGILNKLDMILLPCLELDYLLFINTLVHFEFVCNSSIQVRLLNNSSNTSVIKILVDWLNLIHPFKVKDECSSSNKYVIFYLCYAITDFVQRCILVSRDI